MSSTRHASPDKPLRQERWASSPEYDHGLKANLVAKRCQVLDLPEDRELVWAIQAASQQAGGLPRLAQELLAAASPQSAADEDEITEYLTRLCLDPERSTIHQMSSIDGSNGIDVELVNHELPAGPWCFPGLVAALRTHFQACAMHMEQCTVTTAIGAQLADLLDYTSQTRSFTLAVGDARIGKTHAARYWCALHPGRARFVEVPPGNDDMGFFRALSRALGASRNLKAKANELRERVEEVLLTGDLLLVIDEAHRLWPQNNLHRGWPTRINWVMHMANEGVPVCMVATPQFLTAQQVVKDKTGWNDAQLIGRICRYLELPGELSEADLLAVAGALLPGVPVDILAHVATYARASAKYLAAVEHVARDARYLAKKAGRDAVAVADVRAAMKQGTIPSDRALAAALEAANSKRPRPQGRSFTPMAPGNRATAAAPVRPIRAALETAAGNERITAAATLEALPLPARRGDLITA